MKITHVQTHVLRTPAGNPLVVGLPAPTDTREFVTVELGTDQGLTGLGLTFFGGALTPALKSAVDTLAGLTIGEDPTRTELIAATLGELSARARATGMSPLLAVCYARAVFVLADIFSGDRIRHGGI